jgi:hypothetical protein
MSKTTAILTCAMILVGCRSAAHSQHPTISFTETVAGGQGVRELTFELTNGPASTCISGNWREARVLADSAHYAKRPAYRFEKGSLEVLLVNTKCDVYDSYVGSVADGEFAGEHVVYGLGSATRLGRVTGKFFTP